MRKNYDLFDKVIKAIYSGELTEITFTKDNIAEGDEFLNLDTYPDIKCEFIPRCPIVVTFDCDEPMLLEDCPDSFLESIALNIK